MTDFSFIQITDHHLLESETALRDGFCPGHAFRMVMRHISEQVADKVDFIISTGDLVEPETDANYQGALKLLGINSSAALPGPQRINIEGLNNFPMYFLPGNHDDREMMKSTLSATCSEICRITIRNACPGQNPSRRAVSDSSR